ncbi:MAG: ribonuclease domain-containing protein [Burkholderiales bacterium]|nr:ribonuclease domain-containing protein [Burkholderiales bacterium]
MRSILRWCVTFAIAAFFAAPFVLPLVQARSDAGPAVVTQGISEVAVADLPREARETLRHIKQGGPFAYERDGVTFGNYEKRLPLRERGHYREYTVKTPGISGRGARRIVVGRDGEPYYTDDHYASFRRIRE